MKSLLKNENKIHCLIAPDAFRPPEGLNLISLNKFFREIQKIDSPENSFGSLSPMSFSTVGATSLSEA